MLFFLYELSAQKGHVKKYSQETTTFIFAAPYENIKAKHYLPFNFRQKYLQQKKWMG